jgi:ribosomal protein L29
MKTRILREQTDEELRQSHDDAVRDLFDLKLKKGSGSPPEQPLMIRELRRDIARMKTLMKERGL